MHKIFLTPELVLKVCEELLSPVRWDRRDIVSFGATCRFLQGVVGPIVWQEPGDSGLETLCRILLDEDHEVEEQTTSSITGPRARLERFNIYASEVRSLNISPPLRTKLGPPQWTTRLGQTHRRTIRDALRVFSEISGQNIFPFPQLHTLCILIERAGDIDFLVCLGNEKLQRLDVQFYTYNSDLQTVLIDVLHNRMTGLDSLSVNIPHELEVQLWAFEETLKSLPHLTEFTLSTESIGFASVLDLGFTLGTQLRSLTLRHLQPPPDDHKRSLVEISTAAIPPFTNLRVLDLKSSMGTANELLGYLRRSPIEALRLSLLMEAGDTLEMFVREEHALLLLESLAQNIAEFNMLVELVLGLRKSTDDADQTGLPSPFSWYCIRHLYRCHVLVSFDFFVDVPALIQLDDKDISDMANAWPGLELLWIRWGESGGLLNQETLTSSGLQPLATKCPNLECVRLSGLNSKAPTLSSTATNFVGPLRHPYILYPTDNSAALARLDEVASVISSLWPNRRLIVNFIRETEDGWRYWPRIDSLEVIVEEVY